MVPTDALVSSIRCISSSVMPARAPIAHEGPPSTFEALKPHDRLSRDIRARPSCQGADLRPPAHCWRPWAQPNLEPRSSRALNARRTSHSGWCTALPCCIGQPTCTHA